MNFVKVLPTFTFLDAVIALNKNEHETARAFISFEFERASMLPSRDLFRTPKIFSQHIKPLDGLRGLSILLVLFAHLWNSNGAPQWLFRLGDNVKVGLLGVEIFFFISGFLITGLLLKEFVDRGSVDLKAFYWRRFVRIFPVFYFFLLITFVLSRTVASPIPNRYFIP